MKRTISVITLVMVMILSVSGCGNSFQEIPKEDENKPKEAETTVSVGQNKPIEYEQDTFSEEKQAENIDTDILYLRIVHENKPPQNQTHYYFFYEKTDDDNNFSSGYLFEEDKFSAPIRMEKKNESYVQVELEGEDAGSVKTPFENLYSRYFAACENFFDDKYLEIAQRFADLQISDRYMIKEQIPPIDVTSQMPESITMELGESAQTELKIIDAKIYGDTIQETDTKTDLSVPFWDDGEKRRWMTNVIVEFSLPKEQFSPVRKYMNSVFAKAGSDAEDQNALAKNNNSDADDTSLIGKWYPDYSEYDDTYIQFNDDGTGVSHFKGKDNPFTYTYSDGSVHLTYSSNGIEVYYSHYGAELILDDYYELYTKNPKKEPPAIGDLTGEWYDPTGLAVGSIIFREDGTGTEVFSNASTSDFTYSINGNRIICTYNSGFSSSFEIVGDKFRDADSYYIKKE